MSALPATQPIFSRFPETTVNGTKHLLLLDASQALAPATVAAVLRDTFHAVLDVAEGTSADGHLAQRRSTTSSLVPFEDRVTDGRVRTPDDIHDLINKAVAETTLQERRLATVTLVLALAGIVPAIIMVIAAFVRRQTVTIKLILLYRSALFVCYILMIFVGVLLRPLPSQRTLIIPYLVVAHLIMIVPGTIMVSDSPFVTGELHRSTIAWEHAFGEHALAAAQVFWAFVSVECICHAVALAVTLVRHRSLGTAMQAYWYAFATSGTLIWCVRMPSAVAILLQVPGRTVQQVLVASSPWPLAIPFVVLAWAASLRRRLQHRIANALHRVTGLRGVLAGLMGVGTVQGPHDARKTVDHAVATLQRTNLDSAMLDHLNRHGCAHDAANGQGWDASAPRAPSRRRLTRQALAVTAVNNVLRDIEHGPVVHSIDAFVVYSFEGEARRAADALRRWAEHFTATRKRFPVVHFCGVDAGLSPEVTLAQLAPKLGLSDRLVLIPSSARCEIAMACVLVAWAALGGDETHVDVLAMPGTPDDDARALAAAFDTFRVEDLVKTQDSSVDVDQDDLMLSALSYSFDRDVNEAVRAISTKVAVAFRNMPAA